jgi:FAD/FMN-containing dehydrogenase/Fe-S oxidoreductase
MASQDMESPDDPAATSPAYDYQSEEAERPDLLADLDERIGGDVRFDTYTRELYATDASAYELTPIGVVFPVSTADVAATMTYCAEEGIPVLPRGGGTSLAGQAVNEAVVLDFTRYMDEVREVDPEKRTARAQSGIYLGDLDRELAGDGLKFAPDPAWGDKSALGGAIGNNSTGAHSLVYGKTDDYIESCEVVLADGSIEEFGEISVAELHERADPDGDLLGRIHAEVAHIIEEEREAIEDAYPNLKRNVSGYDLDMLVADAESGSINLGRLMAGSEGTLGIVTEATVALEPVPETKAVCLLTYDDLLEAMADVAPILEHEPAAVEVMDSVLLDLARDTAEFADVVSLLPAETTAVLLVEFYAGSNEEGREQVADLIADRAPASDSEATPTETAMATDAPHRAAAAMEAHDANTRAKFWKMRKSGLPILLSRTSEEKHISYIEDTAIPAEHLPEFVSRFREILDAYDTFASYYAHAGPGVLHIRPLLNTKRIEDVEAMEAIAEAVTDMVVDYGGSVSGEHGDGRARTQWNRKLYGDHLWEIFRDLKSAFDPDWLLNPGQVCGDVDMTDHLRFDPEYDFEAGFSPVLDWENENGFQGMVELCHGCGGCRGPQETTGGVMCPTYRASEEEITSTRGRANMLRQAMSGDLPEDEQFDPEFMQEVLDLCIGCKGCAKDCPSEVDMAKLKAELTHEYHQRHGASLRDRVFANIDLFSKLGSATAPLSNLATAIPGSRRALESGLGIARDRTLPTFHPQSFAEWFEARGGPQVSEAEADRRAVLLPDTYTNYSHPRAGRAAVYVLEAAGVHLRVPEELSDSGRPAHSKGFLDKSREQAKENVSRLAPLVGEGWDVLTVEPSDAVMYQSDYRDLLFGPDREPTGTIAVGEGGPQPAADGGWREAHDVERVAANTYGICEYVDVFDLDRELDFDAAETELTYHGHCHQKATRKDHHAVGVLRRAGYSVDPLDSGCCGMAGSFGYEAEHLSMSRAIASILYDQVEASSGEEVVAPGASCRTQLGERYDDPPHPIEKVAEAVVR